MGFFSSIGSALSSMGSALTGSSSTLSLGDLTGGWVNYSSGQSKLKDAYKRAINASQTLALNSPSWTVQGLRNAGLNPILALQDGSITAAHGVNPSMASGEGGSSSFSFSKKAKSEQQLLESQVDNAKANAANLAANSAKIRNDIKNDNVRTASDVAVNNAKIANMAQDTENKSTNRGLGGAFGMANQFVEGLIRTGKSLEHSSDDSIERAVRRAYERSPKDGWKGSRPFLLPEEKQVFKKIGASLSNSAKDFAEGYKRYSSQIREFNKKYPVHAIPW